MEQALLVDTSFAPHELPPSSPTEPHSKRLTPERHSHSHGPRAFIPWKPGLQGRSSSGKGSAVEGALLARHELGHAIRREPRDDPSLSPANVTGVLTIQCPTTVLASAGDEIPSRHRPLQCLLDCAGSPRQDSCWHIPSIRGWNVMRCGPADVADSTSESLVA